MVIVIILMALFFSFMNGVHDSRNVVSTLISSRAYSPRLALALTTLAEFSGPFVFGVAVAQTIGKGIVVSQAINEQVLIVALASAILWNLVTWFIKLPSSSSHALIGGLLGAATMRAGTGAIQVDGLLKILMSLFFSPVIGFFIGYLLLKLILQLSQDATPRINNLFKKSQIITALALVTAGTLKTFSVPIWVVALCAFAISFGTAVGGWKLIHTVGGIAFYKIRPVDGFTSQVTSALVIFSASLFGGPVSATQVIQTSIMGIGAADRANKVRWGIARDIVTAWILTIPATTFVSAGIYYLVSRLF